MLYSSLKDLGRFGWIPLMTGAFAIADLDFAPVLEQAKTEK
ncbi:MAG: hypothetical protein AAGF01_02355 [Cyanobacteria bacterium P01_G01_bin.38]